MLRIMMLLAKARSDVMFAHYAVKRNIIHAVNITAAGNIICPQGQTSFSVNAPLRASRYSHLPFFNSILAVGGEDHFYRFFNAQLAAIEHKMIVGGVAPLTLGVKFIIEAAFFVFFR